MPFDANGIYSLPSGYLGVTGETIEVSQHNTPLEDIQAALSSTMLRTGAAAMTGALKAVAGSASTPGVASASALSSGLFWYPDGRLGFSSLGAVLGGVPIGVPLPYFGTTAPTGWLFPYGQNLSRTTYALLFAVYGTTFGSGDGSTTFGMPDVRDRALFGKGNMGGSAANRITNQSGGWEGDTLGAAGGAQTSTLAQANLPNATLTLNATSTPTSGGQSAISPAASSSPTQAGSGVAASFFTSATFAGISIATTGTTSSLNGGVTQTAVNNLPPGIVCNYIIFAGV